MTTAFDVRALGSVVRVELDDSIPDGNRDLIKDQWSDLIGDGSEPVVTIAGSLTPTVERSDPSNRFVSAASPERLATHIATEVTLAGIGKLSGSALMLHAGGVALDDGRVIALVGPSGRGKTTATQVLGRELGYVTDETLAVRPDGTVISYRKPLSIGRDPDTKTPMPASGLGLQGLPSAPLVLDAIVVLDRRDHVDVPRVEQVPLLEALNEIVPQTSFLSMLHDPLRTLVTTILSTGGVRRVVYSEAETLPGVVDEILSASSADAPFLVDVNVTAADCGCDAKLNPFQAPAPLGEADAASLYGRTEYQSALTVDDSLVVLKNNRVTVLEGIGPVVWFAADGSTEAELTDAALREMPTPPDHIDPAQVVAATVGELIAANLLVRA